MDIYTLLYLLFGFLLGFFIKKMIKLFFFVAILLLIIVLYDHYSITHDDISHITAILNYMTQKIIYLIKYLYNTLTFLKVSAIILGVIVSLLIA